MCALLLFIGFGLTIVARAQFVGPGKVVGPGKETRKTTFGLVEYFNQNRDQRLLIAPLLSPGQAASRPASNPIIGPGFRISRASAVGGDRNASEPDVAYNPDDNEFLVVWQGDGLAGANFQRVNEIFGQRINAATSKESGANFRISNISDVGKECGANSPQIVYNSTAHEYLVVWYGSGTIKTLDKVFEIYGQRLTRTGNEIGGDFRISHTTDLGKVNTSFVRASNQAHVAWNSVNNQYLVIWSGMGQPEDVVKLEIYGQLLTSGGEAIGHNFRISDTTDQGDNFQAGTPDVAYNSTNNQYLVVWSGGFKDAYQFEIWGQGLTSKGGRLGKGNGDFRISHFTDLGNNPSTNSPRVVYNGGNNEYFVVFSANAFPSEANNSVSEIFGQRIDAATLGETGPQDFRISNTTGANNQALTPRVTYGNLDKEYLVIWLGVRANAPFEIFGQRVSLNGIEIDADFQISNIAAVGSDRTVNSASVAYNNSNGQYLVVWQGNALPGATDRKINEVFGQQVKETPLPYRRP